MKSNFYRLLAAVLLLCSGQGFAETVLLPYGQDTHEPWEAKYFYASEGDEGPDENWFAEDFDDSEWGTIQGPISNVDRFYYATEWGDEYHSTYWVRRRFTVENLKDINSFYFKTIHDDECEAYINGQHIYYHWEYVNTTTTHDITRDIYEYIHEGENILAVKVNDNGEGEMYMDFGLYGDLSIDVINGDFNSTEGWTGYFYTGESNGNYTAYQHGGYWNCQQNIFNNPEGLYMLSANACGMDYYDDFDQAYKSRNEELSAKMFINNTEQSIPNAFSETAETDIYNGMSWQVDGGYVPYSENYTQRCFERDMYKAQLYSYYEPDSENSMTVGIHCYPSNNDIYRWAAWDNMKVSYIEENELDNLLDSIVNVVKDLPKQNFDKNLKDDLTNNLQNTSQAQSYADKGRTFANIFNLQTRIRKSIESYEAMNKVLSQLTDSLNNAKKTTSPATIKEATDYASLVNDAYNNGNFNGEQVKEAVSKMNKLMHRMDYLFLDITLSTPGTLGDSILSKVDNFVDVYSLKISGVLNSDDYTNIQSRLTNLREIDMTDVNMTDIPENFFNRRQALEIVKLPKNLVSIGGYAFYECTALEHIDFPATLTTILDYGFAYCYNLQEVILPEGLTTLSVCAFYCCNNNKYLKLPSTLKYVHDWAFYDNSKLKTVDFSEGLTHIYNNAFKNCHALTHIKFPSSLYYIGIDAFANDRALSNIEFNEGLFQIGDNAFYDCDALTEVTLPSSLVFASASPFDYCDNLRKVTCLSIQPPLMTDQIPNGLSMEGRELYVPALSINTYKQTSGWDKFPTIKPIDYLPENIIVIDELSLTLPEDMPQDYKPIVDLIAEEKGGCIHYGQLTLNGNGTLSMSEFRTYWDPNYTLHGYENETTCYSTLVNNCELISDKVSIKTFTSNETWTFISYPFDVKVSEIETLKEGNTNWVIRRYDGQKRADGDINNTWVKLTDNDVLNAGEGYIIMGSRYIGDYWQDYSGFRMKAIDNANKNNIFRTNDVVVALKEYKSELMNDRSWNLIGNPYPCFFDTRFIDFTAPITVWDMGGSYL